MGSTKVNEFRLRTSAALAARAEVMRWTVPALARELPINKKAVSDRLKGRSGSDKYLDEFCKVLEWTVTELFHAAMFVEIPRPSDDS